MRLDRTPSKFSKTVQRMRADQVQCSLRSLLFREPRRGICGQAPAVLRSGCISGAVFPSWLLRSLSWRRCGWSPWRPFFLSFGHGFSARRIAAPPVATVLVRQPASNPRHPSPDAPGRVDCKASTPVRLFLFRDGFTRWTNSYSVSASCHEALAASLCDCAASTLLAQSTPGFAGLPALLRHGGQPSADIAKPVSNPA